MDLHHGVDDLRRSAGISHTEPGHGVPFGKAAQKERSFLHARKGSNRVWRALVGKLRIDLIGNDDKIVFHGYFRNFGRLLLIEDGPRGVAGKVQKKDFCLFRNSLFQIRGIQSETVFHSGGDRNGNAVGHADFRRIGDITGLMIDDLVPGGDQRADGQVQRFAYSHRYDTLFFRNIPNAVKIGKVSADRLPQRERPQIGGVMGVALFIGIYGALPYGPGSNEIRFPYAQRDHAFHGIDQFEKIPDPAFGQGGNMRSYVRTIHLFPSEQIAIKITTA